MPEDRDLISSETHELNYLLKKWEKKQHKKNRQILRDTLEKFRQDSKYKPHNRKSFYQYVEDYNILDLLEDLDRKKKTGKASLIPDIEPKDLTIDDPFIHSSKKSKKQKIIKKKKVSIQDLTVQRNIRGPAMKINKKVDGGSSNKTAKKNLGTALIIFLIVIIFIIVFIFVGTCVYRNLQAGNRKESDTETTTTPNESEFNNENTESEETELPAYTTSSLINFIKTCTPLYFTGDKALLLPGEKQKIKILGSYLDNYQSVEILIQGHTANMGIPKEEMKLSIERAEIVESMLKENCRTVFLNITSTGYGAQKEAIQNPSEEKLPFNRRVEIVVVKTKPE